jgi:hypothetical protein
MYHSRSFSRSLIIFFPSVCLAATRAHAACASRAPWGPLPAPGPRDPSEGWKNDGSRRLDKLKSDKPTSLIYVKIVCFLLPLVKCMSPLLARKRPTSRAAQCPQIGVDRTQHPLRPRLMHGAVSRQCGGMPAVEGEADARARACGRRARHQYALGLLSEAHERARRHQVQDRHRLSGRQRRCIGVSAHGAKPTRWLHFAMSRFGQKRKLAQLPIKVSHSQHDAKMASAIIAEAVPSRARSRRALKLGSQKWLA